MKLRCVQNIKDYEGNKFALTIGKEYVCFICEVPATVQPECRFVCYNDKGEWRAYRLECFAPMEEKNE